MKRIAFLSYDWDYEIMSAYYEGMRTFLVTAPDVQVVVFHAYGLYENFDLQAGAFDIFGLCDLAAYDGFVIQGNRMWPPALRSKLVGRIAALGKPVVSINYELPGATCVGTSNYQAMYELVHEVLTHRDVAHPAFINGFAASKEAQDRARAYRDACAELGIADARFYEAGWEMKRGREVAERLVRDRHDLPDAIFCCNDDLAAGVLEVLQENGVGVPQDTFLSGFDNRENSLRADPRITTVDRDYRRIGELALQTVVSRVDGSDPGPFVASPARLVLSPSCGYPADPGLATQITERFYAMEHELKNFYELISQFQPAVLAADSLPDVLAETEGFLPCLGCTHAGLTINEAYLETTAADSAIPYGPSSLLMAVNGEDLPLADANRHIYARFATTRLVPDTLSWPDQFYMVFPLRHNAECVGTLVVEGLPESLRYGFLTFVLTLLSHSVASVRKRLVLQTVNRHLDALYVRDHLTGLFNRFGLDRFGSIVYRHLLRDFGSAYFTFVDIDDMKLINDSCGHELGDQAIRDAAEVIERAVVGENAFAMRYGGDEFLVISRHDLSEKIGEVLEAVKENDPQPYDLDMSTGTFRVSTSDGCTIEQAIEQADAAMYEAKRTRKQGLVAHDA